MAVPLSIIGAAIGEWLGAQSGLGYFSRRMMTQPESAAIHKAAAVNAATNVLFLIISSSLYYKSFLQRISRRMMTQLDGAGVFAPILLLSVVAMIFVWLVTLLEKRMIRWRNDL